MPWLVCQCSVCFFNFLLKSVVEPKMVIDAMKHFKIQALVTVASSCLLLLFMLLCPSFVAADDMVRLQLKWPHHFRFVGYYAAKEKGYYKAAGLDVEIIPNKPGENPVQKVLEGRDRKSTRLNSSH